MLWSIRLPRIAVAIGMVVPSRLAGAIMQGMFRNPAGEIKASSARFQRCGSCRGGNHRRRRPAAGGHGRAASIRNPSRCGLSRERWSLLDGSFIAFATRMTAAPRSPSFSSADESWLPLSPLPEWPRWFFWRTIGSFAMSHSGYVSFARRCDLDKGLDSGYLLCCASCHSAA